MFAFLSQAVTGVFLAMYYRPDAAGGAYESIRHLTNEVFLGEFVRGMHRWGSSVMVILVFLHMARTFFFGAYKYPRELNWVIGVVLLILTMTMSFTGYLLPFDQRSFWATVVGVNINGTGPFVGPFLSDFLRGGAEFGATTLSRFYAIHMMLVPGAIAAMMGFHLYLVAKLGTTAPPWLKGRTTPSCARTRSSHEPAREGAVPPRVLPAQGEGEAVLPLRGGQGLDHGRDRGLLDHHDVADLRRRARPEGGPDDDHLRAPAGVVLLLPLRAAARHQAGDPHARSRRSACRPSAWSCCSCCRSTTVGPERRPERRPIATAAGIFTIAAMAYLTYLGASAGSPNEIDMKVPANLEAGKMVVAQSGCLACHKIGENGGDGRGRT